VSEYQAGILQMNPEPASYSRFPRLLARWRRSAKSIRTCKFAMFKFAQSTGFDEMGYPPGPLNRADAARWPTELRRAAYVPGGGQGRQRHAGRDAVLANVSLRAAADLFRCSVPRGTGNRCRLGPWHHRGTDGVLRRHLQYRAQRAQIYSAEPLDTNASSGPAGTIPLGFRLRWL
jgi:hypothetical protein